MNPEEITSIFKRLCVYVRICRWRMPDIFDGRSAEDLPSEVLASFLESPDRLGWDPAKGPLYEFLLGVLNHKMIDHLRRQGRTAGSLDDPADLQRLAGNGDNQALQAPESRTNESTGLIARLGRIAAGDQELSELVTAVARLDDPRKMNQQLAHMLKTTPSDIVNRKKRLARRYLQDGDLQDGDLL
ncbi:MAG TPA: sigma factor [Candidatus Angelobacter sp.]|nr:sigma factor [Candidatus Angelobacter sp.]